MMPQLIATTDEIGNREQRDILFLSFRNIPEPVSAEDTPWERISERQAIIHWLDDHSFGWEPCFHCSPGTLATPYLGAIYLHVAPGDGCHRYQRLLAFLEDESGLCRFEGVDFWLVPLEKSLRRFAQRQSISD
ncbi:hypothetical protein [Marinobacter sp. SS5-14b]|uniref:hypothetical protein n=1 Tax=Marinobacter sp. SS5-14b TaxID=3050456 RepID=UPI0026DFFAC9|nr:hypothetical protein [Marinobacter sp. SS5-14b]